MKATTAQTVTLTHTAPGVIADETATGTAALVEAGTYEIESVDHDGHFVYIDVPSIDGWYVAVHTDWLSDDDTLPAKPKN